MHWAVFWKQRSQWVSRLSRVRMVEFPRDSACETASSPNFGRANSKNLSYHSALVQSVGLLALRSIWLIGSNKNIICFVTNTLVSRPLRISGCLRSDSLWLVSGCVRVFGCMSLWLNQSPRLHQSLWLHQLLWLYPSLWLSDDSYN